jgi:hypothetical protein
MRIRFDPNSPRLAGHKAKIIERLTAGPATNGELSRIGGLRFGARLKELRDAGFTIKTSIRNHDTGLVVYELINDM